MLFRSRASAQGEGVDEMRSTNSERSWWQALSDFLRALDAMEDYSPYDGLAARVAQLERRVAELEPASVALPSQRKDI